MFLIPDVLLAAGHLMVLPSVSVCAIGERL
jgi:hypothetical protein